MSALTPPAEDRWNQIGRWCDGIREEFFSGQWAGRPVYLDLEDEVLDRVARGAGVDTASPPRALAELLGPTFYTASGTPPLLSQHVSRTLSWQAQGSEGTPPFLAVLAFLSLVAEGMHSDGEFRASNYYGRFCQAIDLDPNQQGVKTKIANGFKHSSSILWGALNGWLDTHEGRLGLPTAYAFDARVYVGPPLSQALVRDADRRVLPEMFSAYRLRPGQVVSRSDMARLLGDWVGGSRMSLGLKRLLERKSEIAGRIADIACIELQAWDGDIDEAAHAPISEVPLLLTAQLRRHPRQRLYLDVGIERGLSLPAGPFALGDGASAHAVAALEGLGGVLTPLDADAHGWRAVANSSELAFGDLLLADIKLTNSGISLRRAARRLVVLEHDEELRSYTEVSRVQLGTSNLLLCHESLADQLAATLAQIARPEPKPRSAVELQGVPEGWLAFAPVEILAISDTEDVDLMSLVPISWTQVSLGGGFPLPGRLTWLAEAPPEIRASSAVGERVTVSLSCEHPFTAEEPESQELATFPTAGVIGIPPSVDGDYRISLSDTDHPRAAVLSSALVRLRSADSPRPVVSEDEPPLAYCLGEPLGAISASAAGSRPRVDGGSVLLGEGAPSEVGAHSLGLLPPGELGLHGDPDAARENDLPPQNSEVRGGEVPGCLLGVGHYFVLPYFGPAGPQGSKIEGTCKECGLEKWWPTRPRPKRAPIKSLESKPLEATHGGGATSKDLRPIVEETPADWNRLMEATCFAQRGPWSSLEAMTSHVEDAPWFALEAARLLSALGHLSISLHPRTLRPLQWSMAPTTIAITSTHEAILVGQRSHSLLDSLREDIEILDGSMQCEAQPVGPSVVRILGLDRDGLEELVDSTEATLHHPLLLSDRPALTMARILPPLGELVQHLRRLERPPDRPLEQFDFATAKWSSVDEVEGPGAYRFQERPLRYCVAAGPAGELLVADNRLAKWLAAQQLGLSLLAYDEESMVLTTPLGSQLPGLYERAAVLCSGRAPKPQSDGSVIYGDVPNEVAAALWAALGSPVVVS